MAEPAAEIPAPTPVAPGGGGGGGTLLADLLCLTADDSSAVDDGLLAALVALLPTGQPADDPKADLVQYLAEVLYERLLDHSLNVVGKALFVLLLLCDKSTIFLDAVKANQDMVCDLQRLESISVEGRDVPSEHAAEMIRETARDLLLRLGVTPPALSRLARGRQRVQSSVVGSVTSVGRSVVGTAATLQNKAGKRGLRRGKVDTEDGATKEQRAAAARMFDMMMRHGQKVINRSRLLADEGCQVRFVPFYRLLVAALRRCVCVLHSLWQTCWSHWNSSIFRTRSRENASRTSMMNALHGSRSCFPPCQRWNLHCGTTIQ